MSTTLVALSACSFHASPPPSFSASGFVADEGIVRLWRKNDDKQQVETLQTIYSPYRGDATVMTRYSYQDGVLHEIKRTDSSPQSDKVELRFDRDGGVSFMQRQLANRRESLSSDEIALYQYQARRVLELSEALNVGRVKLVQGRWQQGKMQSCQGQPVNPNFDNRAQDWIHKRAAQSNQPLGVAWLDAPEGMALLLVANEDFCRWEPTAESLD